MKSNLMLCGAACVVLLTTGSVTAAPVYLNESNITVAVGAGTSPGTFRNTFDNGNTITKVIDAPSADAEEFHNQTTHIWFTADEVGGGLELIFDFGQSYDISLLHFWNYTGESYDVDNIDFTFFNAAAQQVGALSIQPDLGTSPGIRAQDIPLAAPLNVRTVTAFLSGSNREVDFQNIGFTAEVSTVPLPLPAALFGTAVAALAGAVRRRKD
ncbi:MAG: PEP-CTERM sorting domain-containing protein [Gammaproteobacteria bacterium]